jgi:hypothetical protein
MFLVPRYYSPHPLYRMVGIDLLLKIRYQNQILHNEEFEGMVAYINVEPLTRWTDTPETMHGEIHHMLIGDVHTITCIVILIDGNTRTPCE